jgi:hypothetical protein
MFVRYVSASVDPAAALMTKAEWKAHSYKRYQGEGSLTPALMAAAERVIHSNMQTRWRAKPFHRVHVHANTHTNTSDTHSQSSEDVFAGDFGGYSLEDTYQEFDPSKLSPTIIKAIYAHQLQLDAVLPPRMAAHCRLWAEDRCVCVRVWLVIG